MRSVSAAVLLVAIGAHAAEPPADLLLRGGDILTQDPAHPHARAVATRGGFIVALDAAADKLVGPKTRVIELDGRAVVPSLTDAHAHLAGLGFAAGAVDLRGCTPLAECVKRVEAALYSPHTATRGDKVFDGRGWILGRGWDQNRFPDDKFPTHAALDKLSNPVSLERVDGHALWVNRAAMRAARVDRGTKDPAGGKIIRDDKGEPTGIFVDNAMSLIEKAIPEPTATEIEAAIVRAQALALTEGLTEIHDMGIDPATAAVYARLAAAGKLQLRVYAFGAQAFADNLMAQPPVPARPGAMFTMRGIKLYADGALGSRGAALLAPYADDPGNTGLVITPAATIEKLARAAVKSGWQVAVHAIGDRGNRNVLDAFAAAGVGAPQRFRIEHAQVVALDDIARFKRLGVIASMQPTHATSDSPWAEKRVGAERIKGAYAWRRMLDAGVPLAFGSDFPVEEPSVVAGFRAAVERGGWTVAERLTLAETLRAFTVGAAYAGFEESWRGRAAPGMAADLTIFDRAAADLLHARADATIVAGRVVYERR